MHDVGTFLTDWNPKHTAFQIENFIIRQGGITPWGMYRQALREAMSRRATLLGLLTNTDRKSMAVVPLHEDDEDLFVFADAYTPQQLVKIAHLVREFCQVWGMLAPLRSRVAALIEDGQTVYDMERQFWSTRIVLEARDRGLSGQPLGKDIMDHARVLGGPVPDDVVAAYRGKGPEGLDTWTPAQLPEYTPLAFDEVPSVLDLPDAYHTLWKRLRSPYEENAQACHALEDRTGPRGRAGAALHGPQQRDRLRLGDLHPGGGGGRNGSGAVNGA